MTLEESNEKDETVEYQGLNFVIEPMVKGLMVENGDIIIDYADSFLRKGFTVEFKNAAGGACC